MSEESATEHDGDADEEAPDTSHVPVVGDDDEETEEAEATPEPEPESTEAKSEREIDAALKKVERAGTTYRNAVSRAMGEDANALVPCPRCNAPVAGMVFPPEVAPVDDETRDAVLASVGLGAGAARQLRPAKGVKECEACGGEGVLEFPTKVPHTKEQQCVTCQGSGYVLDQPQNVTPLITTSGPFTPTVTVTQTAAACPICGSPDSAGKPHYCVPAASVGG
jgi:hypothetical protein